MKKRSTTFRLNKVDYSIFILCSLGAAVMLFLFYRDLNAFTIKQTEEPIAKIYFKRNTAQRKFADNDIWEVLTNSSDIYDGDRIRTSKNSEAYTEFSDSGIQIQLREKSMVQIFKNKKERSVDFIGGEIFIANNSAEEKLVVHSGKKEIAVSKESEVKIALPEVSEAAAAGEEEAEESSVIVEVVSGTVEIIEQPEVKTKTEKLEVEPIIVSAGETVTLVPEVVKGPEPVLEEIAEESVIEVAAAETGLAEEPEVESAIEELSAKEAAGPELEKEAAPVKEAVKEKPVIAEKSPATIPPKPVKPGVAKTVKTKIARFLYNEWDPVNHKYEYAFGFPLADGIGSNTVIPAGSMIEITFKGTVDHDLRMFALQISTGEEQWKRAHVFKNVYLNHSAGIKEGVPFEEKMVYLIDSTIVNTNTSWCGVSYGPEILDQPVNISDFEVYVKVVSASGAFDTKTVVQGYTKTLEYPAFTFGKDYFGDGKNDYDYRFIADTNDIFTEPFFIPKGTKIKITVSGTSDTNIQWMNPEFIYLKSNGTDYTDWIRVLLRKDDWDFYQLRFSDNPISKNKPFSVSKVYTLKQDFENTRNAFFYLTPSKENVKNNPTFTDMKITFEVLE